MPPEFRGKWRVGCFNTRLPLLTLLHARKSIKLGKNVCITKEYKSNIYAKIKQKKEKRRLNFTILKYIVY